MDDQVEGVDRISSLPQSILHHILSFIDSPDDLFITSVLSKEWKMIWGSFPIFDFDFGKIMHVLCRRGDANPGAVPQDLLAVGGEGLTRYGNYRLAVFSVQRDVDARSFALEMWPRPAHVPFVDGWIQIMVDKNVKELYLSINPVHLPRRYTLPNTILNSTKLTSLTVDCCDLPVNFMSHGVPILSLTSLTLRHVRLSDQALQKLTVVFPSVKELYLFWCLGYTKFILPLLKKLAKVELSWESTELIQLDAPVLQHLTYGGWAENISFKLSKSISSKLKTLYLSNTTVLHTSAFSQLVSSCTGLEELWLSVASLEEKFILTSLSLKKLTIGQCLNVQEIRINAPGLEFFSYKGEPFETAFFFTSQTVKCKAHMRLSWTENGMAPWLLRLNSFLRRTVLFKALHMQFGYVEVDVDDLNDMAPFVLDEIVVTYEHVQPNYRQIFAAVFCCCHPLSLTIKLHHQLLECEERDALFRYIYEQLQREEDQEWEKEVHILAGNASHHTQWFRGIEEFIRSLPALRHYQEVCFRTRSVERISKKRIIESCSSSL